MTAEELIIGHYEKTLTSEQESHLASMVESSPEVRTLFEQHGNIQGLLAGEAATIETSSKLDKVVVGAALGTLVEIAGHGIGFSILGKVATIVGAVAVGGAGFVLYNSMQEDDAAQRPVTPAVQQANPANGPVMPPVESRSDEAALETPAATPSAQPSVSTPADNAATTVDRSTASREGRAPVDAKQPTSQPKRSDSPAKGGDLLNPDGAPTTIVKDPKIADPNDPNRPK